MSIFVDANVLFAAAVTSDVRHERAKELLLEIQADRTLTTDHVTVEAWSLINLRFDHSKAMAFWTELRASSLEIEFVNALDFERAHAISESWLDQEFDLVDCTSFAVMERVGGRRVASFDADFAIYRFGRDRNQAFEIIR